MGGRIPGGGRAFFDKLLLKKTLIYGKISMAATSLSRRIQKKMRQFYLRAKPPQMKSI